MPLQSWVKLWVKQLYDLLTVYPIKKDFKHIKLRKFMKCLKLKCIHIIYCIHIVKWTTYKIKRRPCSTGRWFIPNRKTKWPWKHLLIEHKARMHDELWVLGWIQILKDCRKHDEISTIHQKLFGPCFSNNNHENFDFHRFVLFKHGFHVLKTCMKRVHVKHKFFIHKSL